MRREQRAVNRYLLIGGTALGVAGGFCSSESSAATIVAPVTAVTTSQFISSSGNDYFIENTIDQSGLSLPFISGVTDFDSYLASKPMHTSNANGNEWFSQDFSKSPPSQSSQKASQNRQSSKFSAKQVSAKGARNQVARKNKQASDFGKAKGIRASVKLNKNNPKLAKNSAVIGTSSSTALGSAPLVSITYGFSGPLFINGFVLWNDEFAGIGTTQLLFSLDGITYTLLSPITPQPSTFAPTGKVVPYLAQFFPFDLTKMLFFKLLIYDCPGPPPGQSSYRGCGIGEVAFSAELGPVDNNPIVPLPAALPLLASALGLFAWVGRRRKSFS